MFRCLCKVFWHAAGLHQSKKNPQNGAGAEGKIRQIFFCRMYYESPIFFPNQHQNKSAIMSLEKQQFIGKHHRELDKQEHLAFWIQSGQMEEKMRNAVCLNHSCVGLHSTVARSTFPTQNLENNTFESSDGQKLHASVTRSTFGSQNLEIIRVLVNFLKFKWSVSNYSGSPCVR